MRVSVAAEKCIGSGLCALTAPDVFDQTEDGVVTLLNDAPGWDRSLVRRAEAQCPASVISVHDDG